MFFVVGDHAVNLANGGSATVTLEYLKTGATITYTPRVLAGSGTP